MDEEKMMILRMLQEGRITPEEALKLLEALEKRRGFPTDKIGRVIEETFSYIGNLSSELRGFFETVFGPAGVSTSISIPQAASLEIDHRGGNLRLRGVEEGRDLTLSGTARHRYEVENGKVKLHTARGDAEVSVPAHVSELRAEIRGGGLTALNLSIGGRVSMRCAGGSVEINGLRCSELELMVAGGGLSCSNLSVEAVRAAVAGGNLRADLGDLKSGRVEIDVTGGNVELKFGPSPAFSIEGEVIGGDLSLERELDQISREGGRFSGSIGEGGAEIKVSVRGGYLRIK
ncbi:hypothetical protein DRP77_03365 [Candidatus Poribacteria bacterium]|nr:MAG: hypothetical protein DRP77_03365 [Candidatus Poribacteria bacterium]